MPRDVVSRTANVGTVGKNGLVGIRARVHALDGIDVLEVNTITDKIIYSFEVNNNSTGISSKFDHLKFVNFKNFQLF